MVDVLATVCEGLTVYVPTPPVPTAVVIVVAEPTFADEPVSVYVPTPPPALTEIVAPGVTPEP